jgi:AcrR family transcriptional regulator
MYFLTILYSAVESYRPVGLIFNGWVVVQAAIKENAMQQRSEETRQQILDAAQMLFAQHGYEATSVAQICDAAGLSKGAFYHHFPTKQMLFLELLENWLNRIDSTLDQSRWEMADIPDALVHMANVTRGIFQEADGGLPMFLEFWSQARLDPEIWQVTIAPYRRYQKYFKLLIKEGIEEGSLKDIDPHLAALMIVSLAIGMLLQYVLDPQAEDWGEVATQSMRLLLGGLARSEE